MIRLDKLVCKEGSTWKEKGWFLEGKEYWGTNSKVGNQYVVKDDRGYWVSVANSHYTAFTKHQELFDRQFDIVGNYLVSDRETLRKLVSMEDPFRFALNPSGIV